MKESVKRQSGVALAVKNKLVLELKEFPEYVSDRIARTVQETISFAQWGSGPPKIKN